ncbi:MAG TPA: hypothetical protein PL110_06740 [Candidatus Eremiobacteraeota bacterium]|nr:MAG: hypothetical protein BWY64_02184 [bacterium ADurb.Bin363]HPZ07791.1 hypothetical protein [Candidatus Eremiobacteraeota bacterium]
MSARLTLGNKRDFVIGSDLRDFIAQIANSSVKSEILEYFYYNPTSVYNPFLIAQAIGRKEEQVKEALNDFVESGLLRQIRDFPSPSYVPTENNSFHDSLDKFIRLFNSSNGRDLVRSIIDDMAAGNRHYHRAKSEGCV